MYAVVKTGGKQYRVAPGDVIRVEKLAVEAGALVELDEVLMLGGENAPTQVGLPRLAGAVVTATVLEQMRDSTVLVFKKKRRHNYRRTKGHRQHLTVLRIGEILPAGSVRQAVAEQPAPAAAAGEPALKAEAGPKKETAPKKAAAPRKDSPAARKPAAKTAAAPAAKARAGKDQSSKPKPKSGGKAKPGKR
jgi:large subunit ribosomal protein L21